MKKRLFLLIGVVLFSTLAFAQERVNVWIVDGIQEGKLKSDIEENATALLTEINKAQAGKRQISFAGINISSQAQESLSMLWSNVPFYCEDSEVSERLVMSSDGYQIRNIPITLTPEDVSTSEDLYQEAIIDFSKDGKIQAFYFGLSNVLWKQVMNGQDVSDLRRRQMILDYVEHFRTAYNQKDINFLEQVFSDDAIIISGKVIKTKPTDFNPVPEDRIEYVIRNKKEYMTRLKYLFSVNKYIKVTFSEIKITRHATKTDFYGVLLRQGYESSIYSDDGYLFLLWDFRDENNPQIHVRTWQPYFLDENKTIVIDDEEIFDISSFDF